MSAGASKYVFGPVHSRRLGWSLGVDLVPFKTCTLDCVYCQLGRTTDLTLERREYVPVDLLLREVGEALQTSARIDYVTLGGSGEPTLHSGIGALIDGIKALTQVPVAVLTNGSLLYDPGVRGALLRADVVIPSLDAGNEEEFRAVNRPHSRVPFGEYVAGLETFRREYTGQIWLEILLVAGMNTGPESVGRMAAIARRIRPDRIHLNTVVRPPADGSVSGLTQERMEALCGLFEPVAEVVGAAQPEVACKTRDHAATVTEVFDLLARHPATVEDVCSGLGIPAQEAQRHIDTLLAEGRIEKRTTAGREFYVPSGSGPANR